MQFNHCTKCLGQGGRVVRTRLGLQYKRWDFERFTNLHIIHRATTGKANGRVGHARFLPVYPPETMKQKFTVEVAYCQANEQSCVSLQVSEGCSATQAIEQSKLLNQFGLSLEGEKSIPIGIFGKQVSLDTILKPNDRVEIYRPLLLSPTEARRLRAKTRSGP